MLLLLNLKKGHRLNSKDNATNNSFSDTNMYAESK